MKGKGRAGLESIGEKGVSNVIEQLPGFRVVKVVVLAVLYAQKCTAGSDSVVRS